MKASPLDDDFDVAALDAAFHLRAVLPRPSLTVPMGVPHWGTAERRIVWRAILRGNAEEDGTASASLERALEQALGVRHCIAVESGREAIRLVLLAAGLAAGDEVIVPDFMCLSALTPVLELGLTPVLADIRNDLQIDPRSVLRLVGERTRAVIVPHLFGGLAPIDEIRGLGEQRGILVVDDAAQAIGLRGPGGQAGCGGSVGVLSFGLFKPINATGGGALITDSDELHERARALVDPRFSSVQRTNLLKVFLKTLHRRHAYVPFLLRRVGRSGREQAPGTGALEDPRRPVAKIAPLEASLAEAQVEGLGGVRASVREGVVAVGRTLRDHPSLEPCLAEGWGGTPRYPVRLRSGVRSGELPRLFAGLLEKGVEVHPPYRPLHVFLREWGIPFRGEFERSLDLSRRVLCLPLSHPSEGAILQAALTGRK